MTTRFPWLVHEWVAVDELYLVGHLVADVLLHPEDSVLGQGILVHQMVQLENTGGEKVREGKASEKKIAPGFT